MPDDFFTWADATVAKLSAKANLAQACRYARNPQEALSRFVTDGRLETEMSGENPTISRNILINIFGRRAAIAIEPPCSP